MEKIMTGINRHWLDKIFKYCAENSDENVLIVDTFDLGNEDWVKDYLINRGCEVNDNISSFFKFYTVLPNGSLINFIDEKSKENISAYAPIYDIILFSGSIYDYNKKPFLQLLRSENPADTMQASFEIEELMSVLGI